MAGSIDREDMSRAWRSRGGKPYDPPLLRSPAAPPDTSAQRRSLIVKKLQPDQKGTRRLSARFGDRLVCVRYRTDPESGRRFTTVEIVVEERAPITPAPSHKLIRIGWEETRLHSGQSRSLRSLDVPQAGRPLPTTFGNTKQSAAPACFR